MKATGIIRRLDELGRIVIPKETRTALGFEEGITVELSLEGQDIIIEKGDGSNAQARKVDSLGRVVIPMSIRKALNLNEDDRVEIFIDGEGLIFRRYHINCIICGSFEHLIDFKGKKVCKPCVYDLKREDL